MRWLPGILHRHGIALALMSVLGSAWVVSIFAADYFFVNLPGSSRTFTFGQSGGMVGMQSHSRSCTVDFICSYSVFGSPSSPVSLWRDPHGTPRYQVPLPVYWESHPGYYWSFSVSYWLLGSVSWLGLYCWHFRRGKKLSLEMAALPQ